MTLGFQIVIRDSKWKYLTTFTKLTIIWTTILFYIVSLYFLLFSLCAHHLNIEVRGPRLQEFHLCLYLSLYDHYKLTNAIPISLSHNNHYTVKNPKKTERATAIRNRRVQTTYMQTYSHMNELHFKNEQCAGTNTHTRKHTHRRFLSQFFL